VLVLDVHVWNARPSLNEALLEVSCVTHCRLVNSFLHETADAVVDPVQVGAVRRSQVGCSELWSLLLQQLDSVVSAVNAGTRIWRCTHNWQHLLFH